jgi:hypothetical protein
VKIKKKVAEKMNQGKIKTPHSGECEPRNLKINKFLRNWRQDSFKNAYFSRFSLSGATKEAQISVNGGGGLWGEMSC